MGATQVAILFPAILMLIMLGVQGGLWWHSKQVANAAAAEAVSSARTVGGADADGAEAARRFLDQAGNLSGVTIDVSREDGLITAEIHGRAPSLIPPFDWTVAARSQGPVERFIAEPDR